MQMIDVLKRLAELDSNSLTTEPAVIAESSDIAECGPMGIMPGQSHTPASINMTAGSGEELSGMLKDIMSLAGLQKVEPEHLGIEPEPMTLTAEPVASVGPSSSDGEVMRGVIDKLHMDDEEGDEEETDESWDNTPADPNSANAFDAEEFANHENQGGAGETSNGEKRIGTQPTATYESLMAEYQKFIAESVPHINSPGSDEWHSVRGDQDYEQFVNGNEPNFKGRYTDNDDKATQSFVNFLKKKSLQVDAIDDRGSPVIVAMCQGKMCAWYDLENAHGYVAPQM